MESFEADSAAAAAARWEGETVGRYASGAEWGVMDLGDGGAVLCRDPALASQLRRLANHGDHGGYDHRGKGRRDS